MKPIDNSDGYWRRRLLEGGFWILTIAIMWTLDTLTKMQVRERTGFGKNDFGLIVEQATSAGGVLVMVIFVAWWLNHFPIRRSRPASTLLGHLLGSVIFSLGHYTLLIGLRKIVYFLNDLQYGSPVSLLSNLVFEYQKDVKIYVGIVAIIAIYRNYLGGENRLQLRPESTRKIMVQTGSGESIVDFDQIEYLESARNYIVVHSGDREFLVRDTMTGLLDKLAAGRFARSHRSFAVNLDKIVEIVTAESGHTVRLENAAEVPLSRNYRDEFKSLLLR